jgi:hypothetical protein
LPPFISPRKSGNGLPNPEDGGSIRNSFLSDFFSADGPVLQVLKSSLQVSHKVQSGSPNSPDFFFKYSNYVNLHEHFDFP